jgi:hypothetical protein
MAASETEVTDEMLTAAMRAFELMSSVLRYREKDKWHSCDIMGMRDAIKAALVARPAALSDQVVVPTDGDAHEWHMKPTTIPDAMFKRPTFVADALRKMVANCVSLHAVGSSLYTDGERKIMLAAAEHIEAFVAAPPPASPAGVG